jgi:hypothetical protein
MAQVMWRGWNGLHGNWARRWAWLEYLGDGWYQLRWRGGDYSDRDGRYRVRDSVKAVDALERLLTTEVIGEWREIPT